MTQGPVVVFTYAAGTPLLLPLRTQQDRELSARRAIALAFLAIQKYQLGVPEYVAGRCENHAAKVGDAVMMQFWDGFVRASPSIMEVRKKLAAVCAAPNWGAFMDAEKAVPNVPKAGVAAHITDQMLDRALEAAKVKLASLPPLPTRVEPPMPDAQGKLFDF